IGGAPAAETRARIVFPAGPRGAGKGASGRIVGQGEEEDEVSYEAGCGKGIAMLRDVLRQIEQRNWFVLTSHARPDGVAIGSALACCQLLRAKIGRASDRRWRAARLSVP